MISTPKLLLRYKGTQKIWFPAKLDYYNNVSQKYSICLWQWLLWTRISIFKLYKFYKRNYKFKTTVVIYTHFYNNLHTTRIYVQIIVKKFERVNRIIVQYYNKYKKRLLAVLNLII